ncbi:T9SS type A sorting domain-containing protein [Hymenobacter negativus]|uniref:T9SS type A sorting domain-containing protein n=1 Tax=Hymenobacter negativus TaxID=2795026 RepID=A0ABS0Q7M2_9BACT|nr:T9SS type A sorting domain-containing protein [Hymenobacter negativus]MBH8558651.1 T9SS type A sorting domain-containing protein [Hymenobacter negativus]
MKKELLTALLFVSVLAQPAVAQLRLHREPQAATQPATAQRLASNTGFRQLTALKQQYRGGAWLDTLRYTYSRFTALNKPLRELRENAPTRGAALRALRQENYQYNAAGKLTSDSTFVYTNGTLNTTATLAMTYTYDTQGNLLQELQSVRVSGSWRPYGRTTYTYNAQGQNTRILDESYFGSSYLADDQELFTYNAQGQVTVDDFQLADVSGTTFSPFQRDLFTYNAAGQRLTDTQQGYSNGAYVNAYRVTNTYTATPIGVPATPQLASYVVERASGATAWVPYSQGIETYDTDGNLTTDLYQVYTNGAYANDYRYVYTYQRLLATTPAKALQVGLALVPNPSRSGQATEMHYTLPAAASVAVTVFDGLGRVVFSRPAAAQAAGEHMLPLAQLPPAPGLYTVRLMAGTQSQAVKLVVE